MHVSLTTELENIIKKQVNSGLYNSASEVVREALRVWHEQQEYKKNLDLLRTKLELAEQSSLVEKFSMNEFITQLDNE